jgi:hypothetical protein
MPFVRGVREMIIYLAITFMVVVAVAVAITWYGFRQQTNMSEALGSLVSRVKAAASLLAGVEHRAAFAERFDDIDHELQALPAVGSAWQDYRTYLVRDSRSGEMAATRSAASFFDDRLAYRAERTCAPSTPFPAVLSPLACASPSSAWPFRWRSRRSGWFPRISNRRAPLSWGFSSLRRSSSSPRSWRSPPRSSS